MLGLELLDQLKTRMPPLRRRRRPNVAAFVGLLTGGLGLAIYFATLLDVIAVVLVWGVLIVVVPRFDDPELTMGVWLITWALWGLWGYERASYSNRLIGERESVVGAVAHSDPAAVGGLTARTRESIGAPSPEASPIVGAWWTSPGLPTESPPLTNVADYWTHQRPTGGDDATEWWKERKR